MKSFSSEHYRELEIRYDPEQRALWYYRRSSSRPYCTTELFEELLCLIRSVENYFRLNSDKEIDALRYLISASRIPGVFNYGGDLTTLLKLIRTGDRRALFNYAKACIDIVYVCYHLPITTISLVQGDALGGGFEGALTSRILIAERKAQIGLPEVLFNFFPGVSAYSLLVRRLDPARAERLILSGHIYSAEELHAAGVVDILAEDGKGEEAVSAYIKKHSRAYNTYVATHSMRRVYQPLSYDELMESAKLWVNTALKLSERDLRIMDRFAQSQEKLVVFQPPADVKQFA